MPRLGARCPGITLKGKPGNIKTNEFSVRRIEKIIRILLLFSGQWRTYPEPCHVRCAWPLSLRGGDQVRRRSKDAFNDFDYQICFTLQPSALALPQASWLPYRPSGVLKTFYNRHVNMRACEKSFCKFVREAK